MKRESATVLSPLQGIEGLVLDASCLFGAKPGPALFAPRMAELVAEALNRYPQRTAICVPLRMRKTDVKSVLDRLRLDVALLTADPDWVCATCGAHEAMMVLLDNAPDRLHLERKSVALFTDFPQTAAAALELGYGAVIALASEGTLPLWEKCLRADRAGCCRTNGGPSCDVRARLHVVLSAQFPFE